MPRFKYKARNMDGMAVEAMADAVNDDALERELARQGLLLISASPVGKRRFVFGGPSSVRLSPTDLVFLTMELGTSYSAGLPVLATLEDMITSAESQKIRDLARGLSERIRGGASLAESMAAFPKAFPGLYVELISASERTGKLEAILEDLVRFLEWQKDTKSQIVGATIYPLAMIGAVVMLTLVLTLFVFPRFLQQFAAMGDDLPVPTKMLLAADGMFRDHKTPIVAVTFAIPTIYFVVRNIPSVRWRIDSFKLRVPLIGPMLTKILMSRFAHNLAMMLSSGLDFGTALRLVERLMGNVVIAQLVADARMAVEQGKPLSDAMGRGNFMPSLVKRMLKLGESTGEMESSLENVSKYYDKEIPKAIKGMFAVMEPLILVVMAGVVLFMASAILLPMYNMITKMGQQ
jgi:type IV pilus assembly protein PilC